MKIGKIYKDSKNYKLLSISLLSLIFIIILIPLLLILLKLNVFNINSASKRNLWNSQFDKKYYSKSIVNIDWHKIDFGAFTIETPKDFYKISANGIDSYVGGLTNGIDTITFDYGRHSYSFQYENKNDYLISYDTLNGYFSQLYIPKNKKGLLAIGLSYISQDVGFVIGGSGFTNLELVKLMFSTLIFSEKKGYSSVSFGENYVLTSPYIGKELYEILCYHCHGRIENRQPWKLENLKFEHKEFKRLYPNRKNLVDFNSHIEKVKFLNNSQLNSIDMYLKLSKNYDFKKEHNIK